MVSTNHVGGAWHMKPSSLNVSVNQVRQLISVITACFPVVAAAPAVLAVMGSYCWLHDPL